MSTSTAALHPSAGAATWLTEILVVPASAPAGKSSETEPSAVVTSLPALPTGALPPGASTFTAPCSIRNLTPTASTR